MNLITPFFLRSPSLKNTKNLTAPNFHWKRLDTNEVLMTTAALTFPRGLNRTDKGVYSCIVKNKHGSNVANITMNILCEFFSFFLVLIHFSFFIINVALLSLVPMIVFKHQPRIILYVFFVVDWWHFSSMRENKRNDKKREGLDGGR